MKQIDCVSPFSPLVILTISLFGLTSCATSEVKRDPVSPPVSSEFAVKGHINKQSVISQESGKDGIPALVTKPGVEPPKPQFQHLIRKYSLAAVNVPVKEILFKLAQDSGKQLDLNAGVNGTVTINAINQDLPTILKRMSDQLGFLYDITADSIVVKPDEPFWKSYEVDYVNIKKVSQDTIDMKMAVGGASSLGGAATSTGSSAANVKIEATHDFWAELEENLSRIVGAEDTNASAVNAPAAVNKNVVLNEEAGVITIFSTGKVHKIVKDYLEKTIDRATRQVLIEATVVEVQLSDEYQAGVDWSAPIKSGGASGTIGQKLALTAYGSGSPFSGLAAPLDISFGDLDWNVAMKFLQQFGNTKVLSSPKIMAVNNQTALLKVVDNQVYFTITVNKDTTTTTTGGVSTPSYTYETEVHTVPVGFMMNVTPFVGEGDSVTLNVRPTISRIIDSVQDPSPELRLPGGTIESKIPVVQEREMSSVLKLRDKQTAIIGGLIEDSNSNEKNAVPWVNEIPFFGDLFSYKNDQARKSELIIFIRPIVVKNPDVDNGDLSLLRDFLKTERN